MVLGYRPKQQSHKNRNQPDRHCVDDPFDIPIRHGTNAVGVSSCGCDPTESHHDQDAGPHFLGFILRVQLADVNAEEACFTGGPGGAIKSRIHLNEPNYVVVDVDTRSRFRLRSQIGDRMPVKLPNIAYDPHLCDGDPPPSRLSCLVPTPPPASRPCSSAGTAAAARRR